MWWETWGGGGGDKGCELSISATFIVHSVVYQILVQPSVCHIIDWLQVAIKLTFPTAQNVNWIQKKS